MNNPPFSVAISVYKLDNPVFFRRALESITDKQTIKPSEIVLVVDGEVGDETNDVIKEFSNKYVFNVIRLKTNQGLGNALKVAVLNSQNQIIARMDSDDVSAPDRFEQQLKVFSSNPKLDLVGGDISEFIDDENNVVGFRKVPVSDADIKSYLKKRCPLNHVTVMFKKESVINSGGYLDWHFNEDYYLWIRMYLNNCVFENTGTNLVNVRTGNDQYSRRGGWKYFKSEYGLQKFMWKNKIINFATFIVNTTKRFIFQCILPKKIRGFFYRKFARTIKAKEI